MCEYFHIPFQSGDNDILREMKRGYTHERYRAIIDNIRRYMPDASVSGDVIVGFPGETEEQYMRTEQLVREVGFDRVNTAAYSPRPNTPAAEWENQVRMEGLDRGSLGRVYLSFKCKGPYVTSIRRGRQWVSISCRLPISHCCGAFPPILL